MEGTETPHKGKWRLSYAVKIMLTYLVMILVPTIAIGIYFYMDTVRTFETGTVQSIGNEISIQQKSIMAKMDDLEKKQYNIITNPSIAGYFNTDYQYPLDVYEATVTVFQPYAYWVKALNSNDFQVYFYTKNKKIFENSNVFQSDRFSSQAWYAQAIAASPATPCWLPVHVTPDRPFRPLGTDSDGSEISVLSPLISQQLGTTTVAEISTKPEYLFEGLTQSTLFKNGLLLILDKQNKPVYSSGALAGKLTKEDLLKITLAAEGGTGKAALNFGDSYICKTEIAKLGYVLCGVLPAPAMTSAISHPKLIAIFSIIAGTLVMLALSVYFSRTLAARVDQLVFAMRNLQVGQLDHRMNTRGHDEFSELGRSFNHMAGKIEGLVNQVYKTEILQKEAQLKALENQINPHFLYNSLETIKMLAEINSQETISDAITSLGSILKYNLTNGNVLASVSSEITVMQQYCTLQNLMMNNRLQFSVEAPRDVLDLKMMKCLIQPVIENSIQNFFEFPRNPSALSVCFERRGDYLTVTITDNGTGMSAERLEEVHKRLESAEEPETTGKGTSIGLTNVHRRIRLRYGEKYGIMIESWQSGTAVTLMLPAIN